MANPRWAKALCICCRSRTADVHSAEGCCCTADHEPQTPNQWEQWLKVTRTAIRKHAITADAGNGKPDKPAALRLIHTYCRRRLTTGTGKMPALLSARGPMGLA